MKPYLGFRLTPVHAWDVYVGHSSCYACFKDFRMGSIMVPLWDQLFSGFSQVFLTHMLFLLATGRVFNFFKMSSLDSMFISWILLKFWPVKVCII